MFAVNTTHETNGELLDCLRLHMVPGIGPRHSQLLFDHFGSAQAVLSASIGQLQEVEGIGPQIANSIAACSCVRLL